MKVIKYVAKTAKGTSLPAHLGTGFKCWDDVLACKVLWGSIDYSFMDSITICNHPDFPETGDTYFSEKRHWTYDRIIEIVKVEEEIIRKRTKVFKSKIQQG